MISKGKFRYLRSLYPDYETLRFFGRNYTQYDAILEPGIPSMSMKEFQNVIKSMSQTSCNNILAYYAGCKRIDDNLDTDFFISKHTV